MSEQMRVAIVTGAAGGIGSAITRRLEKDGVEVLAVDLDLEATETALGGVGTAFAADLTMRAGNESAVAAAICPGYVRTPLVERQIGAQAAVHAISEDQVLQEVILAAQPVKRLIEPEEVAELASYLLGPHGRSFTGVPVSMDQGWTAR